MEYVNLDRTGLKVSRICEYGSPAWREWVLAEEAYTPHTVRGTRRERREA